MLSASKAFNLPGLKCAQIIAGSAADARVLAGLPPVANHGTSPLGLVANIAAYERGDAWLDQALGHLDGNRALFADGLAEQLPRARMRPLEATYLAWVDLRAYGEDDPAAAALERGRVMVRDRHRLRPGRRGPRAGQPGHVTRRGSPSSSVAWATPSTPPAEPPTR